MEEATAMVPSRIHGEPRITNKFYHREKRLGQKVDHGNECLENLLEKGFMGLGVDMASAASVSLLISLTGCRLPV